MEAPVPMEERPKSPLLAKCKCCSHVWPAVWLPCDMTLMSKVQKTFCPNCGASGSSKIFLATAADLPLYVAFLETELARAKRDIPISSDLPVEENPPTERSS